MTGNGESSDGSWRGVVVHHGQPKYPTGALSQYLRTMMDPLSPLSSMSLPPLGSLPLAGSSVDRGGDLRLEHGLFERLWADPNTLVLSVAAGRMPVRGSGLVFQPAAEVQCPAMPIYLGSIPVTAPRGGGAHGSGTSHVVLATCPEPDEALAPQGDWMTLREAATVLNITDTGLFAQAAAISNWHASHTHCPRCGEGTRPEAGGWVRRCPSDDSLHYPRTDPAVIVAVLDADDRLLLGSAASWPAHRFSTLAGFVEPGESLEAAVVREIFEESGLEVHSPHYLGSQPWPFPASLMLGFSAVATQTTLTPDGVEITDLRWFTRRELFEAVRSGAITVAGKASIARAMIERWFGGPLDEEPAEERP